MLFSCSGSILSLRHKRLNLSMVRRCSSCRIWTSFAACHGAGLRTGVLDLIDSCLSLSGSMSNVSDIADLFGVFVYTALYMNDHMQHFLRTFTTGTLLSAPLLPLLILPLFREFTTMWVYCITTYIITLTLGVLVIST